MTTFDVLDNPIWESLTSIHANMARSNGSARRYASQVSPLAAVSKPTPTAFSDLAALMKAEEQVGLFTAEPLPASPTCPASPSFVKALVGADHRLVGFTAFGAEASEMMAVAQTAMLGGLPYTVLRDTIWTHPTAAEGLLGLFANPPSAPAPQPSVSSRSVKGGRPASTVPATAKE